MAALKCKLQFQISKQGYTSQNTTINRKTQGQGKDNIISQTTTTSRKTQWIASQVHKGENTTSHKTQQGITKHNPNYKTQQITKKYNKTQWQITPTKTKYQITQRHTEKYNIKLLIKLTKEKLWNQGKNQISKTKTTTTT